MSEYKLQRWWIPTTGLIDNGWETVYTSHDPEEALHAYHGWCRQIIDGTFRVVDSDGTVLVARYGSLYMKAVKKDEKAAEE